MEGVMQFCCQGFGNLVANAGERGMSVTISRKPGGFRFELQSRAVTKCSEDLLSTQQAQLTIAGSDLAERHSRFSMGLS